MPTYEYQCGACQHRFEQFQSITANPLRKCPACGKRALQRLLGAGGGILFRGSGFHQTDYRSESYKKAAEAEKSAAGGNGKPGESKSAEKPAAAESRKPAKSKSAARPSAKSSDA